MRVALLFIATLAFGLSTSRAQQDEHGIPHEPKDLVTLPSPDGRLVAIARTPVPATDIPDHQDADGTLLFIRGPERGDRIISHRFFAGRFISKMLWSPDSQFLALCSESAGGHSPWHFNSYFWSRSDRKFRSIDYRAGLVLDDTFAFAPPHSLTLRVAPPGEGMTDHPIERTVDLADLRRRTPPLRPSPWP
jgi:hypothetical protein